jgi:hypothetical protein
LEGVEQAGWPAAQRAAGEDLDIAEAIAVRIDLAVVGRSRIVDDGVGLYRVLIGVDAGDRRLRCREPGKASPNMI